MCSSDLLQRAVDQLIHDIGIMNLPVRFLIDRAGIVGQDGETHHGLFDIALLKNIPNYLILAPSDGEELRDMIHFAARYDDGPLAIRYPRGSVEAPGFAFDEGRPFLPGRLRRLTSGRDLAIFTFGDMVPVALEVREILGRRGIAVSVVNLLTVKPLDVKGIERVLGGVGAAATLENGMVSGGAGEFILSSVRESLREKILFCAGFPDRFVPHGTNRELLAMFGLDAPALSKRILKLMPRFPR